MATSVARAALRERLGPGARWDAPEAPARELSWARTGTAYFARFLNELADSELDAPSLVPGWSRRHVIAQVGYQARALTRLTSWAATGIPTPMYGNDDQRRDEIENGATLPSRALRGLFRHAAVHLDVEWRDLTGEAWDAAVAGPDGGAMSARCTPWMRAREVWLRAVDLDSGGSFLDFPPALVDLLIKEMSERRHDLNLVLAATDRHEAVELGDAGDERVSGRAPDIARWLTGRGTRRLQHSIPLPNITLDLTT